VDRATLEAEIERVLFLPRRGGWDTHEITGRTVRWAQAAEFAVAWWAIDGLVVHLSTIRPSELETLVDLLPR
jgi:hypothetical protein